jgi:hypothetical protein
VSDNLKEELEAVRDQVYVDLLDALDKADSRLRWAIANESTIGMREAAEAIIVLNRALEQNL